MPETREALNGPEIGLFGDIERVDRLEGVGWARPDPLKVSKPLTLPTDKRGTAIRGPTATAWLVMLRPLLGHRIRSLAEAAYLAAQVLGAGVPVHDIVLLHVAGGNLAASAVGIAVGSNIITASQPFLRG